MWLEDLPVAALNPPPPSTDISTCSTWPSRRPSASRRAGAVLVAADWEWGVGANTQQSGQLATIATVNRASGVAIEFVLAYNGTGGGTITLYNSQTDAQLATTSYTNATNPPRVGNAVLSLPQEHGRHRHRHENPRDYFTKINQQAQSIDLETAARHYFQREVRLRRGDP